MKAILLPAFLLAGLAATGAMAQKAEVDCAMCHDSAPVPANHMPVDEVSVQTCGMCHQASGDDQQEACEQDRGERCGDAHSGKGRRMAFGLLFEIRVRCGHGNSFRVV